MTERDKELLSLRMEMVEIGMTATDSTSHASSTDALPTDDHLREMESLLNSQRPSYVKVGYSYFCETDRLPIGSLLVWLVCRNKQRK